MNETKEPVYPEEAIEVLIAERDGLKKRAEKAEAKLSSMAGYSIELQRLIDALSGGHPVPDAARAPMYRALAKGVKDERDALRKRVVELEAASMDADREIRGALVWAGIWGNPAIVVSQLKCSVSGATEAIAERDTLKAKLIKAEHERDVARGMAIEAIAFSESATRLEERVEKAEAKLAEAEVLMLEAREELHCMAVNSGASIEIGKFQFGHPCDACDEYVDRNGRLRKKLDAFLADVPKVEGQP